MVSFFVKRAIDAFERRWGYDGSYMREILVEAGLGAILPLDALGKVSRYRRGVPASVYYAAKVTASLAADCGPCAQLVVSMAEADGVDPALLRTLVASDRDALGPDERLGYDLARATLAHENADEIRSAILARWGRRGVVSLAYALVAAQAFPTFKYAAGYARACTRVRVNGAEFPRGEALPA
ncbi:MAG: hypothetical protein WCE44_13385 [Candidatus Velthaea sp.]